MRRMESERRREPECRLVEECPGLGCRFAGRRSPLVPAWNLGRLAAERREQHAGLGRSIAARLSCARTVRPAAALALQRGER